MDFYLDGREPKSVGVRRDFDLRFVPFKLRHEEVAPSDNEGQQDENDSVSKNVGSSGRST